MSAAARTQAVAILDTLAGLYPSHPLAVSPSEPFHALVATVLSARTKDPVTNAAMARLWQRVSTPAGLLALDRTELAALLKPVGFYETKAKHLQELSRLLLDKHGGQVPRTREELLELPGVGRKVANLVLNICFDIPAICVDTHVHRIANRLGWAVTDTPEQTERALEALVPESRWAMLNRVLVNHGQQICQPASPFCSRCPLAARCPRTGVSRMR
jgi:endonuclease III